MVHIALEAMRPMGVHDAMINTMPSAIRRAYAKELLASELSVSVLSVIVVIDLTIVNADSISHAKFIHFIAQKTGMAIEIGNMNAARVQAAR